MHNQLSNKYLRHLKDFILIACGIVSACFGLKSFLMLSGFIDAGWKLSYLIVLINIPFVILGFRQIGKVFAVKTAFAIAILATMVYYLPFQPIPHDKLLIAFFGGLFLGGGIGMAMRSGVIDGTEVLALYINKNSALTVGIIILILNIIIFAFAAYFLNIETALYAILTYLSASSIVTIYKGEGGYGEKKDIDLVFTVVTKLEMTMLRMTAKKDTASIPHATPSSIKKYYH